MSEQYAVLDTMLRAALILKFHGDKKDVKKLLLKLKNKVSPTAYKHVLSPLLKATSYSDLLYKKINAYIDYGECARECSEMGAAGMVCYNGEAYPVQIKLMDSRERSSAEGSTDIAFYDQEILDDRAWILKNEPEMQVAFGHAVMNHLNLPRLSYTAVLFANRGFSGISDSLEIEKGVAEKFNMRIGNSNYYL